MVGCAPIAAIAVSTMVAMIVETPSMASLTNGLVGALAAAMICFITLVYGDSRIISGMRTSTSDFLTALQVGLAIYLLVYLCGMRGGDPKVARMLDPYFGTPVQTIGGVIAAGIVIHVLAVSYRWMTVVASRYPSRAPTVPTRTGGI